MIKQRFIELQVAKCRAGKRTTPFLRRLVAGTVDEVARIHYAEAYPTKCVQTSIAVQRLLGRLGIASRVWLGAFCAAEVFETQTLRDGAASGVTTIMPGRRRSSTSSWTSRLAK